MRSRRSTKRGESYRREILLGLTGLAGAKGFSKIKAYLDEDRDNDGLQDAREESGLSATVSEIYGEDIELSVEEKNLILDIRYIGDVDRISENTRSYIEELFGSHGIETFVLEYPERYSEWEFEESYSYTSNAILEDFYDDQVEEEMKRSALQVISVPGLGQGEHEGKVKAGVDGYVDGVGRPEDLKYSDRLLITSLSRGKFPGVQEPMSAEELRRWVLLHEIGHSLGLNHRVGSTVMNVYNLEDKRSEMPDYSSLEWSEINQNLRKTI